MAADHRAGRGNCELTKPGQTITTENGTIIVGVTNLPATLPVHASQVYANNMVSLVAEIVKDGAMKVDLTDDIQKGATITHDGQITNELVKKAIAG
jgi:NAD(P) transhydrogenase subunit alpha